jgi:hypothetical protein
MVSGLLVSQIGHDAGEAVRVVYRGATAEALPEGAELRLSGPSGSTRIAMRRWGACWGAHWWTAECGKLATGTWQLELDAGPVSERAELEVAPHRLWRASWRAVALEQLERRTRIARQGHGTGWQDCGCDWQEANSHASCVIGLADTLLQVDAGMDDDERRRLQAQVEGGCRLLNYLQDEGPKCGLPPGALVHEMLRAKRALPRDALWAALAWALSARAIGGATAEAWRVRAHAALAWWSAQPIDNTGMDAVAHAWTTGYVPPAERSVVDLALAAWAYGELASSADDDDCRHAAALAEQVMARQIAPGVAGAPYGNFWEFSDHAHPAPVWTHNNIGPDTGDIGLPPALALARLLRRFPGHADAGRWRKACTAHAEGWLEPSAAASPFGIAARLWRGGWIHFAGLWHGMNAVYGVTSVLCDELAELLDRPQLRAQAAANRQWIAGLNAGITPAVRALGCHISWPTAVEGRALPASMITGVGRRWIGGWMAIPGTIANSFSAGDQFRFDVPADPSLDGPTSYTDEDWIPHAGFWVMAVARCAG